MGWIDPQAVLLSALGLMLVSAGIEDVRCREIANWKNAAIALAAPAWWWAGGLGWSGIALQLALAAIVFAAFCVAFGLGMMGGGDVKLIGALALWLPFQPLMGLLVAMSLAGGAVTLAMMVDRRVRRTTAPVEVPYGVAIAVAGLLALPTAS